MSCHLPRPVLSPTAAAESTTTSATTPDEHEHKEQSSSCCCSNNKSSLRIVTGTADDDKAVSTSNTSSASAMHERRPGLAIETHPLTECLLTSESSESEITRITTQAVQDYVSLLCDPEWKLQATSGGVTCFKNMSPSNARFSAFLGVADLPVSPLAVAELISQSERKTEYDEIFESSEVLHAYHEACHIERWKYWTPSPMIVARRNLVLLAACVQLNDDTLLMLARSVQYENKSSNKSESNDGHERKGFLRARAIVGGFLIQALPANDADTVAAATAHRTPLDAWRAPAAVTVSSASSSSTPCHSILETATRCRVLYLAQIDLKGSMPRQLQNKLFERQPLQIAEMAKILKQEAAALANNDKERQSKRELYHTLISKIPRVSAQDVDLSMLDGARL